MTDGIGLGFLVNVLVWSAGIILVAGAGVAILAALFPGAARKAKKGARALRGSRVARHASPKGEEEGERYRKAS